VKTTPRNKHAKSQGWSDLYCECCSWRGGLPVWKS